MNKELKDKWVNALYSGKYKQAIGGLRTGDFFCCLGVLCDIVNPNGWEEDINNCYTFEKSLGYLPKSILEIADFTHIEEVPNVRDNDALTGDPGYLDDYDSFVTLSELNDGGKSFTEIANEIERRL